MNPPQSPETSGKTNKLIIRSEVLAVSRNLVSQGDPSKQERLKHLKRLQEIDNQEQVLDVLLKEFKRCNQPKTLHLLTEFMMERGNIEYLQDKLGGIIRYTATTDEVKDASNLILRHLGDNTDPDLYLEYLDDPQGLIGRETVRMLEISAENPEALIDFIDFILSLNIEDQVRLLASLQRDYPTEYLVNIYIPLLESDPSPELWEQLVQNLADSKSPRAAEVLSRLASWPEDRLPVPQKLIQTSLKKLQLAGAWRPDEEKQADPEEIHPMVVETVPYQCFLTLSDGIGNQGLLFSRQRSNGDISMLSVALNDVHGIIDCFGFFQLSMSDFHKIIEKFHEGATKIKISPEFAAYKLINAEKLNQERTFRLPYEYRCWRPLLDGIIPEAPSEALTVDSTWVRKEWMDETDNLYQHPDFNSWFLEQGDEPCVTRWLQKVILLTEDYLAEVGSRDDHTGYFTALEDIADNLVLELMDTDWKQLIAERLTDAAYLLHCQNTHTFRNLAATEVYKLKNHHDPEHLLSGFSQAYGRRCVLEELLRLRTGSPNYDILTPLVEGLAERWEL